MQTEFTKTIPEFWDHPAHALKLADRHQHLALAIQCIERYSADAHEAGHDEAAQVLIATAGMLRAFALSAM